MIEYQNGDIPSEIVAAPTGLAKTLYKSRKLPLGMTTSGQRSGQKNGIFSSIQCWSIVLFRHEW